MRVISRILTTEILILEVNDNLSVSGTVPSCSFVNAYYLTIIILYNDK